MTTALDLHGLRLRVQQAQAELRAAEKDFAPMTKPTITVTIDPVDLDVVALSRPRYNELLAAETKAKASEKPNPLFASDPFAPVIARAITTPISPDAVALITGKPAVDPHAEVARLTQELAASQEKHRRATAAVAEQKAKVGERERRIIEAEAETAVVRRRADEAEQRLAASVATIEINLHADDERKPPTVVIRHAGETMRGILSTGSVDKDLTRRMVAADFTPGDFVGRAANVTVVR